MENNMAPWLLRQMNKELEQSFNGLTVQEMRLNMSLEDQEEEKPEEVENEQTRDSSDIPE